MYNYTVAYDSDNFKLQISNYIIEYLRDYLKIKVLKI